MTFGIHRTLVALGYTKFEQGDDTGAAALLRETLLLNRQAPLLTTITDGLEGLAMVAAVQGRFLQAARLWGATEAMREISGQRRLPAFQRSYDQTLRLARSQIESSDWDIAWAEGRTLTAAQALAEGLGRGDKNSSSDELLEGAILPL